jgi:hypothetical protein
MFERCRRRRDVRVGMKILYRNARRPDEAGMKLVPDRSQKAAESHILEELGFTVIEIVPARLARAPRILVSERRGLG